MGSVGGGEGRKWGWQCGNGGGKNFLGFIPIAMSSPVGYIVVLLVLSSLKDILIYLLLL